MAHGKKSKLVVNAADVAHLRGLTQSYRRQVDKAGAIIVLPEEGVPVECCRAVQVFLPSGSGPCEFMIGPSPAVADRSKGQLRGVDDAGDRPEDFGYDANVRVLPELPPDGELKVTIGARQHIFARSPSGSMALTIVVEYLA